MNHLTEGWLPTSPDPRVTQYPLMTSWFPTAIISSAYVIIVYIWRNQIQQRQAKRKTECNGIATNGTKHVSSDTSTRDFLKPIMIAYNLLMVIYSAYVVISCLKSAARLGYGLGCEVTPDPTNRETDNMAFAGYLFFFSKLVELLDTVFFLLRGKIDQVTFLHVFHHASMPPSIWWGFKYAPGGFVYTFLLANSSIHTIMYSYYGLAAAGFHKYLWWKNYLTLAQIAQFAFLILHQGQIFVWTERCHFPKVFPAIIVFYASIFFCLFSDFYVKAYWRKQRLAKLYDKVGSSSSTENGHVTLLASNGANGHVSKNNKKLE